MLGREKRMRQNKFLFKFWIFAFVFLVGWFAYWQVQDKKIKSIIKVAGTVIEHLPIGEERKEELITIFKIIPQIASEEEKTFLILFQNNNELRPGGGYIGSFGILKVQGEKVVSVDTHDTNVFDARVETGITPPFPMMDHLKVSDWELRDSNWSPDFPTNAKKAKEMYHLEGGEEEIDGVVAISTELLASFLEITGPVLLEGYPGEYSSSNAIEKLQHQVEKAYTDQGIEEGKRKYVMKDLSRAVLAKAQKLSLGDKKKLIEKVERHLNEKDVLLSFRDQSLQRKIEKLGWSGEMKSADSDYLMMVDANLAALKTDRVIDRTFDYTVDFTHEKPRVNLEITYRHNERVRDWMTTDYNSYLRIFVPDGSWLADYDNLSQIKYGTEHEKKFFGGMVRVPVGTIRTVSFAYDLPTNITFEDYKLFVQKQAGIDAVKGRVKIIDKEGNGTGYDIELKKDWEIKK